MQKYKSTRPSQTTVKIPLLPGKTPQNPLTLLLSEEKEKKGTLSSKPLFSQRFSSIALPPVMFLCKYSSPKLLGIAQKSILFNMHSMLKETQRHLGRGIGWLLFTNQYGGWRCVLCRKEESKEYIAMMRGGGRETYLTVPYFVPCKFGNCAYTKSTCLAYELGNRSREPTKRHLWTQYLPLQFGPKNPRISLYSYKFSDLGSFF